MVKKKDSMRILITGSMGYVGPILTRHLRQKFPDAELIGFMAKHPILIERPVVQTKKGTRLCRPPEKLDEIL